MGARLIPKLFEEFQLLVGVEVVEDVAVHALASCFQVVLATLTVLDKLVLRLTRL